MTNERIYERLSSLFDKLGIEHPAGSAENAELMAYCVGIDGVYKDFELYFSQLFADTASGLGLSLFCELFKIDSGLTDSEKRTLIIQGLGRQYGDYIFGTMKSEFDKLGGGFSVSCEHFLLTVNGSVKDDPSLLSEIGKIIENNLPPCTAAKCSGDGADFDYWDSTDFLFGDYDDLKLGFELLDTVTV